jgi:hypothetical protein
MLETAKTPDEKVRQLQCKLYVCAKQSRTPRFHALYDRIYRSDVLWEAWRRVRSNRGAAGIDAESIQAIEQRGPGEFLAEIQAALRAGRYRPSPRSRVEVYAGLTKTDRFHITFRNKGLRILPQDVPKCVERGWRGDAARRVTGSGSGVGLWLVFHVMRAHNGELLVLPTTPDGWTEVKLLFRSN